MAPGLFAAVLTCACVAGCGASSNAAPSATGTPSTTASAPASSGLDQDGAQGPYPGGRHTVPGADVSLSFPATTSVYVADDPAEGLTDRIASDPALTRFRDTDDVYELLAIADSSTIVVEEVTPGSQPTVSLQTELASNAAGVKRAGFVDGPVTSTTVATPIGPVGQFSYVVKGAGTGTDETIIVPYGAGGFLFLIIEASAHTVDADAVAVDAALQRTGT
jgi:hypothetical protein